MKAIIKIIIITVIVLAKVPLRCEVVYEVYPDGLKTHSLNGAIDDIRSRVYEDSTEDFVIKLDDGHYFLNESLVLDWGSCSPNASLTLIAKDGTNPTISGGEKLSAWEYVENSCIQSVIKTTVNKNIRNLWINDNRMRRAQGFVGYATGIFDETIDGINLKGLLFPKDNFPSFSDISGLEVKYYQNWRSYYFKVDAIFNHDTIEAVPENLILVAIRDFEEALEVTPRMINVGSGIPYYFENAVELMDEPGEWCYSPKDNMLYYFMCNDETIENINAIIPNLQHLIIIKYSNTDNKIENIVFSGLEFSHTNWSRVSEFGFFPKQSSVYCPKSTTRDVIPGAITIEDAKNIKFNQCNFSKLGTNGVYLKNNIDGINIENCTFLDLSGSAVCISDYNHRTYSDTISCVKNINIKNNYIDRIGEEYSSCAGIEAYFCEDLTIANNELYNLPYTGISVGWGWTVEPTTQRNIKVLNNKIVGNTLKCADGGAIYTMSYFGGDGMLIEGNYIDEITTKPSRFAEGAIYTDEGSSNVRINNNVVLADRQWFYHHWAGNVEVDSIYVMAQNHDNYGGIEAPTGVSEIKFIDNGNHIFDIPHSEADRIVQNAGIKKEIAEIPEGIEYIDKEIDDIFLFRTNGGIRIVSNSNWNGNKIQVRVFGIDGSLKRTFQIEQEGIIDLRGRVQGYNILEVICGNRRKVFPLIL